MYTVQLITKRAVKCIYIYVYMLLIRFLAIKQRRKLETTMYTQLLHAWRIARYMATNIYNYKFITIKIICNRYNVKAIAYS